MSNESFAKSVSSDVPIASPSQDRFSVQDYVQSLCSFIRSAETPITVSIQGEWGSGKTSFMKMIESVLCDPTLPEDDRFDAIWLDTWSLFLESDQEKASIKLLTDLISQIGRHLDSYASESHSDEMKSSARQSLRALSKIVLSVANVDPESVDNLWDSLSGSGPATTGSLKNRLGELISREVVTRGNGTTGRGFLIFIDDLDRLSPQLAVSLLETVKNLFDVKYCVFVLAIDFDIVKLGVEQKYGTSLIRGRDVAQEFFDKIIQASFNVPVQKYDVMPLILDRLRALNLLSSPTQYSMRRSAIKSIMVASTNKNPRAIKATLNALQIVLHIIRSTTKQEPYRLMVLDLVALEKAFPRVYEALARSSVLASGGRDATQQDVTALSQLLVSDDCLGKLLEVDDPLGSVSRRARILVDEFARLALECWESDIPFDDLFDAIGLVSGDYDASTEMRYSGSLYDASSTTQFAQGERLVDLIDFSSHHHVLDVGCGNGKTTVEFWLRNPTMRVEAIDISESQIRSAHVHYEQAREKLDESRDARAGLGSIEFEILDFNHIHKQARYDLIFSNSALHWLSHPKNGYTRLFRALKPGGLLAVHQGGAGTYRGLHAIARKAIEEVGLQDRYAGWRFPSFYPTADEMRQMLDDIGFEEISVQAVESDGSDASPTLPQDFAIASLIYYKIPSVSDAEFQSIESAYTRICQETEPDLYTNRLYVFATKPR